MSSNKKLTNRVNDVEKEMMEAMAAAYPGIFIDTELRIALLSRDRKYRVGIISGGGSGHEPFSIGYVGEGMLTAAVAGKIFASPPVANILATIINVAKLNKGGVLLLVMNYTGDVLNFAAAMEEARSKGYNVESLIVADDVSQHVDSISELTGRRGMVGFILLAKILGGLSKEGLSIGELVTIGRCINCRLATLGVCMQAATLPGCNEQMFSIKDNHFEFGVGIHGEAGVETIPMTTIKELVKHMLIKIMSSLLLEENCVVIVVINNLGSLSQMEMLIVLREVRFQLEDMKITVERTYMGSLLTSIDMRGFQICLMNITGTTHWLRYLDEETEAFAWPGKRISRSIDKFPFRIQKVELDNTVPQVEGMKLNKKYGEVFRKCLLELSKALMNNYTYLNELDTVVGDGDCGTSMRHFAEGVIQEVYKLPVQNVPTTLAMLSKVAQSLMGGTSGAIFSLLLMGAAKECETWETCCLSAVEMIQKYTRARLGDRTLLDALIPAVRGYIQHLTENGDHSWPYAVKVALERAEEGCDATKFMTPRAGRASYVDPSKVRDVDPGAYAIVIILRAILQVLVPAEENFQCPI